MQLVAEGWLVYQLTGSPLALGVIRFLHTIPVTLFSIFAGGIADRFDKRRLLLITQSGSLLVALALFFLAWTETVQIWHVGLLAVLLGIANAFDIPVRQSFIVDLVGKRDLMNAIALNASVFNASRVLGPGIGGLVIGTLGVAYCFLLNAVSFLFVLLGYLCLRLPSRARESAAAPRDRSLKGALAVVRQTPSLRITLGMVSVMSVFGMAYLPLMPVFAEEEFGVGPQGLGALLAANGVGSLLGSLTVAYFSHSERREWLAKIGASGYCLSLLGFSACTSAEAAAGLLVLCGWFMVLFFATSNTLIQGQVADSLRGRIMGFYTFCFIGLSPFGALFAGGMAKWLGAPTAVMIGALVCGAGSVLLWRAPDLTGASSTTSDG